MGLICISSFVEPSLTALTAETQLSVFVFQAHTPACWANLYCLWCIFQGLTIMCIFWWIFGSVNRQRHFIKTDSEMSAVIVFSGDTNGCNARIFAPTSSSGPGWMFVFFITKNFITTADNPFNWYFHWYLPVSLIPSSSGAALWPSDQTAVLLSRFQQRRID